MATRLLQPYKTNPPPLEAWTKNIVKKWLTQNFGIKKIESKTDQSKYIKIELVQPIRIKNSVNKHGDAISNIYIHYIHKQTAWNKTDCIK